MVFWGHRSQQRLGLEWVGVWQICACMSIENAIAQLILLRETTVQKPFL
jgi:hypothetical protein